MFSNDGLKDFISKHKDLSAKFLDVAKNGGLKWADVRGFQTILYMEHFEDIEEVYSCCQAFGVPCSLSPLHDKDIKDSETGEFKKPHFHLLAYYKGKTSLYRFYTQLCACFGEDSFFGFDNVVNWNKLVRYHAHLDDKEKAQYDVKDIKDFNGFSSLKYLKLLDGDDVSLKSDLKRVIRENNFIFYDELDDWLEENEFDMYSSLTINKALRREIIDYMKSREHRLTFDGEIMVTRFREVLPSGQIRYLTDKRFKDKEENKHYIEKVI